MIIAVDFDGVLCEDRFPAIGKPKYAMIAMVRCLLDMGHEVILWTSRTGKALEQAQSWCWDRGLDFTSINENTPNNIEMYKSEYPDGTRKVYADVYIDDHNVQSIINMDLEDSVYRLIKKLEGDKK